MIRTVGQLHSDGQLSTLLYTLELPSRSHLKTSSLSRKSPGTVQLPALDLSSGQSFQQARNVQEKAFC